MAAVAENDRVVIIDRKLFVDDILRIFAGIVDSCEGPIIRVRGYLFHVSPYDVGGAERRGEERTRITSLESGDLIFALPLEVEPSRLLLKRSPKAMSLSDGAFAMDLTDFLYRA
ncbi:MAG: hypothetical protein ACREQI_02290 [Candidatus Binataceae bacterium]